MIFVQLRGGLGNQMFQYATARSLSIKNNTSVNMDLTEYDQINRRPHEVYNLNHFNISGNILEHCELKRFYKTNFFERLIFKLKKITGMEKTRLVYEKRWFHYDSSIKTLPDNVYLRGYWQCEKYFSDIRDIILDEYTPGSQLSSNSLLVKEAIIKSNNSVSLHIRRGDYISDKKTNTYFHICPPEYYNECLSRLNQYAGKHLDLFIFSDDIDWAKSNLNFDYNTFFVENKNIQLAFEDIYLMSLCKHNIIANSSFSWWGAYLNRNKGNFIFAPSKWVNDNTINIDDILPSSWIRI
jgi:hypothetical protein